MSEDINAIVLTGYGGYNKIQVQKVLRPQLKNDEVLVRVRACGMNFSDLLTRQGVYTFHGIKPPFVMGLECSGIVEEIGSSVTDVSAGDRVLCWSFRYGMFSELVSVPSINCLKIPDSMPFNDATAIPVQYLTAYLALLDFGHLRSGQSVFIQAAAGGVGWAATQIARTVDNVTVFGTASASKHEFVKENGVTHAIDYRSHDFAAAIQNISPDGVDVVLDCLGGSDYVRSQNILKPMGRIITIGVSSMMTGEKRNLLQNLKVWLQTKNIKAFDIIMNNQSICGLNVATLMLKSPEKFRSGMNELLKLYEAGKIKPKIDSIFSFAEVVEGTKRLVERKNIGKVILVPTKVDGI